MEGKAGPVQGIERRLTCKSPRRPCSAQALAAPSSSTSAVGLAQAVLLLVFLCAAGFLSAAGLVMVCKTAKPLQQCSHYLPPIEKAASGAWHGSMSFCRVKPAKASGVMHTASHIAELMWQQREGLSKTGSCQFSLTRHSTPEPGKPCGFQE